jgi:hypothetical protein
MCNVVATNVDKWRAQSAKGMVYFLLFIRQLKIWCTSPRPPESSLACISVSSNLLRRGVHLSNTDKYILLVRRCQYSYISTTKTTERIMLINTTSMGPS